MTDAHGNKLGPKGTWFHGILPFQENSDHRIVHENEYTCMRPISHLISSMICIYECWKDSQLPQWLASLEDYPPQHHDRIPSNWHFGQSRSHRPVVPLHQIQPTSFYILRGSGRSNTSPWDGPLKILPGIETSRLSLQQCWIIPTQQPNGQYQ